MELLQKIDVKTVDSSQKKLDIQVREKPSNKLSETDVKPFKEQLNEQAEQLNSSMNAKKGPSNQEDKQDKRFEDNDLAKEAEPTTGAIDEINTNNIEDAMAEVDAVENESQALVLNAPKVAAAVFETGNALPLTESLAENMMAQKWQAGVKLGLNSAPTNILANGPVGGPVGGLAGSSTGGSVGADVQAKAADALMQNAKQNFNKLADSMSPEMQTLRTESAQQKSLNLAPSLSATLLEKSAIQDAKFTKMSSEFSTTEVISQAAKLQQVPITTAVSASLSNAQNLSAGAMTTGLISDTANILSQPTPLTNSPLNPLNASITANISSPNWSQQMTQQIGYMVKGGIQQAEIKLNPAHLGPMEIKLAIKDDQATINFVTQHAPVRDAIDAALPRLKDMLEQQGLNLADADVSTQSEQREANSEKQHNNDEDSSDVSASAEMQSNAVKPVTSISIDSGVSVFA